MEKRSGLDYFRNLWGEHPVPAFSTWKEARVWMRGILGRPAEIESLQGRCVEWWKEYKQRYVASVGEFLEERSASEGVASVEGIVFPKYSRRGWQLRELLRHHSAGALRRRATLQLTRMLKERRFRVAATAGPADAE